jgi:hypothetical protein
LRLLVSIIAPSGSARRKHLLRHAETRPILKAFFHARALPKVALKCGRPLDIAPHSLPCRWAAVSDRFGLL